MPDGFNQTRLRADDLEMASPIWPILPPSPFIDHLTALKSRPIQDRAAGALLWGLDYAEFWLAVSRQAADAWRVGIRKQQDAWFEAFRSQLVDTASATTPQISPPRQDRAPSPPLPNGDASAAL